MCVGCVLSLCMRQPKRSIGRRVIAFPILFQYGSRSPSSFLKISILGHVTGIELVICCCVPNFIRIGLRVRLQTPIGLTAKCLMRSCMATAFAMTTTSRRTPGESDCTALLKFRPNVVFPIFSNILILILILY